MLVTLLQGALGLSLLYFGGESLIRGSSDLAQRLGISPLAIGLTVVAFGTSAPELAVSVDAALRGLHDIALGNGIGANIANIGLILGLAVLIRPLKVEAKILRFDAPLLIVASLAMVLVLTDQQVSRSEGYALLTALAVYVAFTFWESARESESVKSEFAAVVPASQPHLLLSLALVLAGLAMLVFGGRQLVASAVGLASALGVSNAVIGLTIVAVGTSLPELAASLVALARGQSDIAVGNVVGSNLFNILGILGAAAAVQPLQAANSSATDLGTMLGLAIALGLLLFIRLHLGRREGALLLCCYVAYSAWLFIR
jgi:cation:H+ antiporter